MPITGSDPFTKDANTTSSETVNLTEFAIPDNGGTILDLNVVARAPSTGACRRFSVIAIASRFNGGAPVVNSLKTVEVGAAALANAAMTVVAGASFSIIVQITGVNALPLEWAIQGVTRSFTP